MAAGYFLRPRTSRLRQLLTAGSPIDLPPVHDDQSTTTATLNVVPSKVYNQLPGGAEARQANTVTSSDITNSWRYSVLDAEIWFRISHQIWRQKGRQTYYGDVVGDGVRRPILQFFQIQSPLNLDWDYNVRAWIRLLCYGIYKYMDARLPQKRQSFWACFRSHIQNEQALDARKIGLAPGGIRDGSRRPLTDDPKMRQQNFSVPKGLITTQEYKVVNVSM
ncbi:hypothetical protein FN846DRAFT_896486 [Sphaerosporella brunnea]|uniref:Uncharacterized protein n=1 Tax=Sphaerosporella brunnea TaxID=1250544 RepID=A0A5J5ECF4_9PEZI|nr:hypothetical protein FN846DRAFT_896486 [Sphaerosporella brunnea]